MCPTPIILPTITSKAKSHTGFEEGLNESNEEAVMGGLSHNSTTFVDKPTDDFGTSSTMPKPTWTCINRMDFGLRGLARAITLPSLGKRDVRETNNGQNKEHET